MQKKDNNDRDLLLISLFTFITVVSWIFFELVKTTKTVTVKSSVSQTIAPLSPKIDMDTLNTLNSRRHY